MEQPGNSITNGLPDCVQGCIQSTSTNSTDCLETDIRCLCNHEDYGDQLACCVSKNCSAADQKSGLATYSGICKSVDLTIPDFVSCGANYTSALHQALASASSMSAKSPITSAAGTGTSTVASLEPGVQFPNTSTIISSYTGKPIFTGSCTQPQFALITQGIGGMFLEYPLVGCSNLFPDCCPFDIRVGGQLKVCPADYYTVSKTGCCPSGYTLHTSEIAGATPCVTTPVLPLVPPDATSNPEVSVINTQLFSVQYTVIPSHSGSSFPTGAIAGVAVGGFILIALALGALTLFIRRRRQRDREAQERERMHEQSTMRAIEAADGTASASRGYYDGTNRSQPQLSELPSPQSAPHSATTFPAGAGGGTGNGNGSLWSSSQWGGIPPVPELKSASPVPPRELEGDTYIHEHHPAHKVDNDSEGFKEANSEVSPQTPFNGDAFSGSAMGAAGGGGGGEMDEDEEFGVESPVLGRKSMGKE